MSAYVIAQITVEDMGEYQHYLDGFLPIFERHGGRMVGRSLEAEVMEGEWARPRTVIMRFPTSEDARRWHADPDYKALAEHRHRSSQASIVLVGGLD
jgi:uncharacterized protein (DUF1330 family)